MGKRHPAYSIFPGKAGHGLSTDYVIAGSLKESFRMKTGVGRGGGKLRLWEILGEVTLRQPLGLLRTFNMRMRCFYLWERERSIRHAPYWWKQTLPSPMYFFFLRRLSIRTRFWRTFFGEMLFYLNSCFTNNCPPLEMKFQMEEHCRTMCTEWEKSKHGVLWPASS